MNLEDSLAESLKQKISIGEEMSKIVSDKKADVKDRIEAAKVADVVTDGVLKTWLLSRATDSNERVGNRLTRQLDKLADEK